jgi:DNA polymerase III subunit chi
MTQVDFYLLPVSELHGRLSFACRLAERAMHEGRRIYLHAANQADTQVLDELLWSFRDASFIPHQSPLGGERDELAPVAIGHGDDPGTHHDVLINLDRRIVPFFGRFARVAEIVLNDEEERRASRERWRYYRDRGYPLAHHDMLHLRSAGGR